MGNGGPARVSHGTREAESERQEENPEGEETWLWWGRGPILVQKILRISRQWGKLIKRSLGPSEHRAPCDYEVCTLRMLVPDGMVVQGPRGDPGLQKNEAKKSMSWSVSSATGVRGFLRN